MSASFQLGKRMLELPQMLSEMLSCKNSNWVRVKLYFIMLPGLGRMPASCSPWQASHHLQLEGKEKWVPQVPGCSLPCQVATPPGNSWARGCVELSLPYRRNPASWWQFPMFSFSKSCTRCSQGKDISEGQRATFRFKPILSCAWLSAVLRRIQRLYLATLEKMVQVKRPWALENGQGDCHNIDAYMRQEVIKSKLFFIHAKILRATAVK